MFIGGAKDEHFSCLHSSCQLGLTKPVASFTVSREYVMRIYKLCDILNYIFVLKCICFSLSGGESAVLALCLIHPLENPKL